MDFTSSLSAGARPQKRKTTYGKKNTTSTYTLSRHEESPQKAKSTREVWSPDPSPPRLSPGNSVIEKSSVGRLARPSPKRVRKDDLFDIPSSEDEHMNGLTPQQRRNSHSPSKRKAHKPTSDRDITTQESDGDNMEGTTRKRKRDADPAEAQLLHENSRSKLKARSETALDEARASTVVSAQTTGSSKHGGVRNKGIKRLASPAGIREPERLGGGREGALQILSALKTGASSASQRLPSRTPPREIVQRTAGDLRNPLSPASSKGTASPAKKLRFEGVSSPRTPPFRDSASPASFPRSGSVTPRQNQLWTKLLGRADATDTPSNLAVTALHISGTSSKLSVPGSRTVTSNAQQPARSKRARLIDTLANTQESADEADDADELDSIMEDEDLSVTDRSSSKAPSPAPAHEPDVPPGPVGQSGARVTYGQTRSYVEDSGIGADLLWDDPTDSLGQSSSTLQDGKTALSQRFGKYSQDEEDLDDSQVAIKSVHELRAAGENRRFVDDFENTLEDIQYRGGASWSRQRTGIMDLCDKLVDKKYVARMIDHGLDERLMQACQGAKDTIFNWAVAVAFALIADAGASLSVLERIRRSECFETLFTMFELPNGILHYAKMRESNMSKAAQGTLKEFSERVRDYRLWKGSAPLDLSPKQAALKAVDGLVRHMRQEGYMEDLLDEQKTSKLLLILQQCMESVTTAQGTDTLALELALSVLEAGSVIPGRIQTAWTPRRMERLAKMLPDVLQLGPPFSANLKLLGLRLMLNLTNTNAKASNIFAEPRLVHILVAMILGHFARTPQRKEPIDEEEEAAIDDELILALGTLINLTEFADAARVPLLDKEHSHLLNGIVSIFLENRGKAAEADTLALTASNVAYGYLTVLLGNFCQNADVRLATAAQLPGNNLVPLIEAIEEFVAYNKVADRSAFDGDEGANVYRVFTERLAEVAAKLRKTEDEILNAT